MSSSLIFIVLLSVEKPLLFIDELCVASIASEELLFKYLTVDIEVTSIIKQAANDKEATFFFSEFDYVLKLLI